MEPQIYQCVCGATFEKQAQLTSHKSRCKIYRESVGLPTTFICEFCGKECKDSSSLSQHINREHLHKQYKQSSKSECPICGKLISNSNIERHIKSHETHLEYQAQQRGKAQNYHLDHDDLFCKFCGKEHKNKNSLVQHEIRCRENPNRIFPSENFVKSTKLGRKSLCPWNKGLTKETDVRLAQKAIRAKEYYASHPEAHRGYTHSEEVKKQIGKKMSQILKAKYDSGELAPNHGIGRGKGSYIIIRDDKYFCRSTYEFIYALYLFYILKKQFSIEKIQVRAVRENSYGNTFRCDFYIPEDNLIVEVKGVKSDKDQLLKESFEAAGYNFVELFGKEINECKKELIQFGIKIDELIQQIKDGVKNKNFFHYTLN